MCVTHSCAQGKAWQYQGQEEGSWRGRQSGHLLGQDVQGAACPGPPTPSGLGAAAGAGLACAERMFRVLSDEPHHSCKVSSVLCHYEIRWTWSLEASAVKFWSI